MGTRLFDALFVVNQNTEFENIRRIAIRGNMKTCLFLATHRLFPPEIESLLRYFPGSDFLTFADFLTDQEMEECDDKATKELELCLNRKSIRRNYNQQFMGLSIRNKNRIVCKKVNSDFNIRSLYSSRGLGIDEAVWKEAGGKDLRFLVPQSVISGIRKIRSMMETAGRFLKPKMVSLIRYGNQCFVFFSPVHRLHLEIQPKTVMFHPYRFLSFSFSETPYVQILNSFLAEIDEEEIEIVISTTIHHYEPELVNLGRPLQIFVDGFHPANYPRTYLDSYASGDFVVRNMFDEKWFRKYGRKTITPYPFLKKDYFREVDANRATVKTVVLLLNHAGDWTALINRSDTDNLIRAFADSAKKLQNLKFVIRLHPTMVHPSHEGKNSIRRIRKFVADCALGNLSVSEGSLREDFDRGDLFVSEYSQTLIDAFKEGKLGIIANLTNRRSFMQDYENFGFLSVRKEEPLDHCISRIVADCPSSIQKNNEAVRRYNDELEHFLNYLRD